jgi:hypothetical protein
MPYMIAEEAGASSAIMMVFRRQRKLSPVTIFVACSFPETTYAGRGQNKITVIGS